MLTDQNHGRAKILDIKAFAHYWMHLEKDQIVIVAGFKALVRMVQITTLGRGGSDTTAVALAAAFKRTYAKFIRMWTAFIRRIHEL